MAGLKESPLPEPKRDNTVPEIVALAPKAEVSNRKISLFRTFHLSAVADESISKYTVPALS